MHHVLAAALLLLAAPAGAATITLDFEEEPLGHRDFGYVSIECGCVSLGYGTEFDEDEPASVRDFGPPSGHVFDLVSDQTMPLTLSFLSGAVDSVSLDFAAGDGDNSQGDGLIDPGSEAVLEVFLGVTKLGEARVLLDLIDGGMDQSIGISGVGAFDRAVLRYEASLSPAIDNVSFTTVPEPGALGLGVLALAVATASRPRRLK